MAAEADCCVFITSAPVLINVLAVHERVLISNALSIEDADRVGNRTKAALCRHRSGVLSVSEMHNLPIRLVHVHLIGKQNEKSVPAELLARDACAA